jgi:redox-sensitive bicupin YhaK (pirin superfamily)
VSGPVTTSDLPARPVDAGPADGGGIEVTSSRTAEVAGVPVRRALPRRTRRTVGAWCFVDHLGPLAVTDELGIEIGPHPHVGLQTVTWLLAGEQLHRDSLGSEQTVRPGQLNLMTAGGGVAHAEETLGYRGPVHGVQLWVALPDATRHGPAAFEHHEALPEVEQGDLTATLLVGELLGARSPARHDTPLLGADLAVRPGTAVLPLRGDFEHAVVVLEGALRLGDRVLRPGELAHLAPGREELPVAAAEPARAVLLGGEPFASSLLMWWNFVARTRQEIEAAYDDWRGREPRFGPTGSALPRIPAPALPWRPPSA